MHVAVTSHVKGGATPNTNINRGPELRRNVTGRVAGHLSMDVDVPMVKSDQEHKHIRP
jgi:hypothetical protein